MIRVLTLATSILLAASPVAAQSLRTGALPQTAPERTDYAETTRYADVLTFMRAVDAASPYIHLTSFGYTMEGRALPLTVVGRVSDASPDAVRASGKTIIYLQGNIHAGEVEGKETLLIMLREIAQGQHVQLLDSLVLLVAPIYNADGNERVLLTNRGTQHGPIGGMGQRANAQGYDLNRDHMKLESPEARSLAMLLQRYDPHVGIDLHTTNGTHHAYHLTYSPPLHPNTAPAITAMLRERWLPAVTRNIRQQHGWDFYYYGNLQGEGSTRGWYTFSHTPRFNNNYLGLRNRFAILSEAYAYATFPDRILATSRFVHELLAFAHANATEIRSVAARADAESIFGRTLALRAEPERSNEPVEILLGEVIEERNPYSGRVILRRADAKRAERMYEYGTFRPTASERVPAAYLIPADLTEVVELLRAHGARTDALVSPTTLSAESFRIDSTWVADVEFQGHRERTVTGEWEETTLTVEEGTVVVTTEQPLARLVFYLLEPRSDDGIVNWNMLDRQLDGADAYPILRTHTRF